MQGFDYERARTDLQIPDNFDVMAMIASIPVRISFLALLSIAQHKID